MENLREMYIYKGLHGHYVVPIKESDNDWICHVFYHDSATNDVWNKGDYFYEKDGTCCGIKDMNVHQMVALSNLHPKVKKAIQEWKKLYKENKQ